MASQQHQRAGLLILKVIPIFTFNKRGDKLRPAFSFTRHHSIIREKTTVTRQKLILTTISILTLLAGTVLVPARSARAQTSIRYAKPGTTGAGDCSSWVDACTLQTALTGAASIDEIWVMQGTHTPGTARTDTFQLISGLAVYGGFVGTETALGQRNPTAYPTILSGDIGTIGDNTDNIYHVVTGSGTDSTAILDGFTIDAGSANGPYPDGIDGGMYNDGGSPTLANITFSNNVGGNAANWRNSMQTHQLEWEGLFDSIEACTSAFQNTRGGQYAA